MPKPKVEIARFLDSVQPYPRNGNVGQRKPRCVFEVRVNGRISSGRTSLKAALEIARDFDPDVTRSVVFDPTPIPGRV